MRMLVDERQGKKIKNNIRNEQISSYDAGKYKCPLSQRPNKEQEDRKKPGSSLW